jgi:hypothetical protein
MLLLVVGLVVIVLVILIVVFLSVRSARADEGGDYPARPAGRARGRRPADDEWLDDEEAGSDEPEPAYSQARSLPRPRGHQHDEAPGSGDEPVNRNDIRRRQGSRPRLSGTTRDRSGGDWPASDWGGVSDEQYWAELSADKPLATTARSAQPGTDAHQAAAARSGSTDPVPADMGGRRRAPSPAGPRPDQAPAAAAATAATAQFSFGSADEPAARQPWAAEAPAAREPATFADRVTASEPADPGTSWAGPVTGTEGGSQTDPGLGGITDWSGTQGDGGAETTTWSAPDSWGAQPPAAEDTRSWGADDPLTSPSFSAQSARAADSRSYRGSTERARAGSDEPAAHAYQPEPGWGAIQPGSYAGQLDSWTEPGHEFRGGTLEPLPGAAADDAAEPVSSWYSAPTPVAEAPSYAAPSHQGWDHAGLHDDESGQQAHSGQHGHRADQAAGYDQRDPYAGAAPLDWQQGAQDYGEPVGNGSGYEQRSYGSGDTGYQRPGYGTLGTEYSLPEHGTSDSGFGSDGASYGEPAYGYGEPGYGSNPGYGYPGHESAGNGYGQPGHESAGNGYGQPGHESAGNGYSEPGHDSAGNGGYQPGYGAPGAGYHQAGYGADYEAPGYVPGEPGYGQSGFSGGPGHGAGYGHYPDYDRGQR